MANAISKDSLFVGRLCGLGYISPVTSWSYLQPTGRAAQTLSETSAIGAVQDTHASIDLASKLYPGNKIAPRYLNQILDFFLKCFAFDVDRTLIKLCIMLHFQMLLWISI